MLCNVMSTELKYTTSIQLQIHLFNLCARNKICNYALLDKVRYCNLACILTTGEKRDQTICIMIGLTDEEMNLLRFVCH